MKKNIGSTDKIIRIILTIAIGHFAHSTGIDTQWVQILLYVIAAILLVTTILGLCPLYSMFKANTCDLKK